MVVKEILRLNIIPEPLLSRQKVFFTDVFSPDKQMLSFVKRETLFPGCTRQVPSKSAMLASLFDYVFQWKSVFHEARLLIQSCKKDADVRVRLVKNLYNLKPVFHYSNFFLLNTMR